jgi:hypothetical protein
MSLLTDASLIVTPNGYNVGTLYSVIPNTTLGDMTVSRALSATRVNSAKFIEIARTNLLLRSEEFDNVVWNKGTGGSISPNSVISPIGTLTADAYTWAASTTAFAWLSQSVSAISQNSNTFSIWLKRPLGSGSRTIRLSISDVNIFTANSSFFTVTETWQRFEFTNASVNTTGLVGVGLLGGQLGTSIIAGEILDVWGAQLEQSSVATDYIPTTTVARTKFAGITQDGLYGLNIPRIDYPPLGGCPSILSEPARTNVVLYSEEFDNAYWTKSGVIITANTTATTAPDGTFTADKFIPDTNGAVTHNINRTTGLPSNAYTFSVFAKAGEETTFSMWLVNAASINAVFDLSTGTYTASSGSTASMTAFPNGWYRCSVYNATPGTTAHIFGRTGGAFAGNNVNGFFIWGAQLEVGTYPTSYIPTTIAAVLRNTDVITRNDVYTNNLITSSGGTWFMELRNNLAFTKDGVMTGLLLDTNIDSFTNGFNIRNVGPGNSRLTISSWQSNSGVGLYTTTTDNVKIAIKWNGATADIFENGTKVVTATPFTPTGMQFLKVNSLVGIPYNINQMALFKTALTDDQCILLTGASFSSYPEMANNFPNALIYTIQ